MEGDHKRNFQKLLVNETYFDRTVQVSIGNYEGALIMLVHSLKKENKELVAKVMRVMIPKAILPHKLKLEYKGTSLREL